jgi:phytanoyl-CoA hydroxylase
MLEIIRRLKATYAIYNFFHRKELIHNVSVLKKYGLKKKYFSPLSSKDFSNIDPGKILPAEKINITETELFRDTNAENQKSILSFEENGFLIIRNYLSAEEADAVNETIDSLLT